MRIVKLAATQLSCTWDTENNLAKAESIVRDAAKDGANIILLQELFETPYFCQDQKQDHFKLARSAVNHPVISRMQQLAKELGVVLPVSFFERDNQAHYNSIAIIDADGTCLGVYRKAHIPDGPGYQEKFYFNPGDTGFKVFDTKFGRIGVLICWDQWFPEPARALVLQGAEVLLYPTAIGSEPQAPDLNSYPHWCRVMCGHAGANLVPLVASNRTGVEQADSSSITFYGGSFIAAPDGAVVSQVGRRSDLPAGFPDPAPEKVEGFITATFDLDEVQLQRASWGLFRDRRPDLYQVLLTLDGKLKK